MPDVHQLKNEARRYEQRGDWERAIELYRQALRVQEEQDVAGADLSLYNRIGDLYLRQGDTAAAVSSYERAVERYQVLDLTSSAIALCHKILRIAPGRTEMFRKLGRLHLANGLLAEAHGNYREYAERRSREGDAAAAAEALLELAEVAGDDSLLIAFAEARLAEGKVEEGVELLRSGWERRVRLGGDYAALRARIVEAAPDADPGEPPAPVEAAPPADTAPREPVPGPPAGDEAPAGATTGVGEGPPPASGPESEGVDLGALVLGELELPEGEWAPAAGPPGPWPGPGEADAEVADLLSRFRTAVSEVVEDTDAAVHYDLGLAYQGMGLYDAAIAELQIAIRSPRYLGAAHEALGHCLRLKSAVVLSPPAGPETRDAAPEPPAPAVAGKPGVPASPLDDPALAGPGSSGALPAPLAKLFFAARLAQFRARQATVAHRVDHQAHYELGSAYREMGLLEEAVRELRVAAEGPRLVAGRAMDVIEDIATRPTVPLGQRLDLLGLLHAAGRPARALALLLEMWDERAGDDEAAEIAARIRAIDPEADPVLRAPDGAEEGPEPEGGAPSGASVSRAGGAADPAAGVEAETLPEVSRMLAELAALDAFEPAPGAAAPPPASGAVGRGRTGADPGAAATGVAPGAAANDPDASARYAQTLLDEGRLETAVQELHRAREGYEERRQVRRAMEIVDRLLTLTPEDVGLYQQKVEYAFMTNDRNVLLRSYQQLAACLLRQDASANARTIYGRILDLDPGNREAAGAIAEIDSREVSQEGRGRRAAGATGAARPPSFLNLGDLLRAELVEEPHPELDPGEDAGDVDFDAMLDRFRSKVTETLEETDYQSHFELGVAFRQMEMLDEAIREFQIAIRGMEDPLRAYELLGECFMARGRYGVAAKLLARVAADDRYGDEQRLGVLYGLGLAYQQLGDRARALESFERVFVVDIDYRDIGERIAACSL